MSVTAKPAQGRPPQHELTGTAHRDAVNNE
jgi:hypothetical protein